MEIIGSPPPSPAGGFRGLVLFSAGQPYIGCGSIREVLISMRDSQQIILGLEGFATDGLQIWPLLDFVADLSDIDGDKASRVSASNRAALRVLDSWGVAAAFIHVTVEGRDD